MKSFKFTIRTKFMLLIFLAAAGGLLCTLFYLDAIHQMKNAGQLGQKLVSFSQNSTNLHTLLPGMNIPSPTEVQNDSRQSLSEEFTQRIDQGSESLDEILLHSTLSSHNSLIKTAESLQERYTTLKLSLTGFNAKVQKRNQLARDLLSARSRIEKLALANSGAAITRLSEEFAREANGWLSTGDAYQLIQLRLLVESASEQQTINSYGLPDKAAKTLESILAESWLAIKELGFLQDQISPGTGTGLVAKIGEEYSQLGRELGYLQEQSLEYSNACYFYARRTVLFAVLLLVSALVVYLFIFSAYLRNSLDGIRHFLSSLLAGQIPERIPLDGQDEFNEMADTLDSFAADLEKKARFATGIGQGNLEAEYLPLSDDDLLGNALVGLRENMRQAKISTETHEAEEHKRRWINEGLAKFAETLRLNNNNINALTDHIIQNTVSYLDANQGGLFLLDETNEEPILELVSSFAYSRKKYLSARIKLGEGLVGTCALEKEPILLTEIPDEYLTITSGLGESNPRCIVLVPLKLEEKVLGVMEIASFAPVQEHQLEFLVKIAESIASTIATVRINMRTEKLLEQSQHQSRILADQEEEMRQNMEELQATQEESKRRENEISGILNAINSSSCVFEFDMQEHVLTANERFCGLVETSLEHLRGKKYATLFSIDPTSEEYIQLWNDLKQGLDKARVESVKSMVNNPTWVSINFTPIRQHDNKIVKVLCIAHDISESKIQEQNIHKQSRELARKNQELESLNQAVDNALLKCAYDMQASITEANENYLRLSGFNLKELLGRDSRQFIKPDEQLQFDKIWAEVTKDKSYTGVIKRTKPTGEELWLMSSFTPVKDEHGNIYKIYYLGQDITERKLKYKLLEEANKEIERLKAQLGGR